MSTFLGCAGVMVPAMVRDRFYHSGAIEVIGILVAEEGAGISSIAGQVDMFMAEGAGDHDVMRK